MIHSPISHDETYMDSLLDVFHNGVDVPTRNATCRKLIGEYNRYDLRDGAAILFSKEVKLTSIMKELFWFNRGETNINTLGCGIWNKWADENGELGKVYGYQFARQSHTHIIKLSELDKYTDAGYSHIGHAMLDAQAIKELFGEIEDLESETVGNTTIINSEGEETEEFEFVIVRKVVNQLEEALERLRKNPMDRRALVCAWNAGDFEFQALPPCHVLYQFSATPIESTAKRIELAIEREAYCMMADTKKIIGHTDRFGNLNYPAIKEEAFGIAKELAEYGSFHQDPVTGKCVELSEEEYANNINAPQYYLDIILYQRSCDKPVGEPFNIMSYEIQLALFARTLNMVPRFFHHFIADQHIYEDQLELIPQQIAQMRELRADVANGRQIEYPRIVVLNRKEKISDYTMQDVRLVGEYIPKDFIPYPVTE